MARTRYTSDGVLKREAARRILRPYSKLLGTVIYEAWDTWNKLGSAAPAVRLKLGRAARAMNVSDFIKDQVARRFSGVGGCTVMTEYGRPVLVFAGGDLKLRLGKIDLAAIPAPRNGRQLRIWSQADATATVLPDMPSGTWAKCGYVLDETETSVAAIDVTCDINGGNRWVIDLPIPLPARPAVPVTPLATTEVPPAKIVSATHVAGSLPKAASSD